MSLGSKLTTTSAQVSYLSAGRLKGAHFCTARTADSAAVRPGPDDAPPLMTSGRPSSSPERSRRNRTDTFSVSASSTPAGMFQQRPRACRSASISLADSLLAPVFLSPPSEACWLERLAPPPDAFSLFSKAAILSSRDLSLDSGREEACFAGLSDSLRSGAFAVSAWATCGFGRAAGAGALSGRRVLSCGCSAAMASAIGSGFSGCGSACAVFCSAGSGAGSGFTSCLGWGLGATSVAGTGFGSSFGFGTSSDLGCSFGLGAGGGASAASTGLGLASGVGGLSVSTLLSPTFCASATISGRCVGVGAGVSRMVAFLSPSRICVIDSTGTISTGRASTSLTSNAEGARSVNKPRASAAACMITDVVSPTFNLLVLFLQGDEADIAEARRGDPGHDLHDGAIVGNLVAAHIDALVVTGLGDGLQLGHHLVNGNF